MARGIALVFAVSATLALAPTVAEAATQRYAAPGGATNVDCTNHDQPCDLPTAFTNAQPNDEVIVETGDYGSATTPLTQPIVSTKAGLD